MKKGQPERRNSSGMAQQASEGTPNSGQACVCLISCFLFLLLVAGGVFLVMFITLPTSSSPTWLLPAGMVLVSSPWIFWILTCIYRCIALRIAYMNRVRAEAPQQQQQQQQQQQVTRQASVAVAQDAPQQQVVEEETVDSPGGARKVRFGNATILGNNSDDGDPETGGEPTGRAEGGGLSREGGGSSVTSRESEAPLTLSMSS